MPSLILTTCGTSLFTNGISNELRAEFYKHANKKDWSDIPTDIVGQLKDHAKQQKDKLLTVDEATVCHLSAELNSLLSWQAQHVKNPQDMYLLLATDTALGRSTAEIIQEWLRQKGYMVEIITASGLNTATLNGFRESLSTLVKDLVQQFTSYKESGYHIYFNLTGGFKGLNGFLQALSTIYADQTFYLFESSQELLFIPKLPFYLDAEKIILENLAIFRRLAYELFVSQEECQNIPDSLLFQIDNQMVLSEWGTLLWESCYKKIYQQKLYPSISTRIIFTDSFETSIKDLSPQILQIVNERIADLAVYTENDCKFALRSVDPKPLQEKQYKDRNLWECDLDPHHRIFMVKEGFSFTLEKITKALH